MRLIDADALQKDFQEKCFGSCDDCIHGNGGFDTSTPFKCMLIENAPTIEERPRFDFDEWMECIQDADRLTGEWKIHNDWDTAIKYGCNVCGNLTNVPGNYCPNCGAKMTKGGQK